MKLKEEMFAAKLDELERQYGQMIKRIRLCQQQDHEKISQELRIASEEFRQNEISLQRNIEGSRSPAVAALAKAQLDYFRKIKDIRDQELPDYLCSETETISGSRAEASALYTEYAVDFAVQSMKYALLSALKAIHTEMETEEKENGSTDGKE